MSNFHARRAPNVSQYIRDLNAINRQETTEEPFNMEEDLALFTNTQFFDFETGQSTDFQAHPAKIEMEVAAAPTAASTQATSPAESMTPAPSVMGDLSNIEFMQGDFTFPDFAANGGYPSTPLGAFPENAQNFQSMPPNNAAYQQVPHHQPAHYGQPTPQSAEKRKSESSSSGSGVGLNLEEASRHAAEEDKRRRNTAASARFRVKKKQREQALEKSAKDMTDKVSNLESKVQQLEMENKWLKNLLVEKNEGNDEIVTAWKEFAAAKHSSSKKSDSIVAAPVKEEQ